MQGKAIVVVGAGIGGLAAAVSLAARGAQVTLLEAAARPGGRMRETFPGGYAVDSGPTVLTLVQVFRELFAQTGERLEDHVTLDPLSVLARHAWSATERLDLHANREASRAAIRDFAGGREADGFDRFSRDARLLYEGLYRPFMRSQLPGVVEFAARIGPLAAFRLRAGQPFASLWGRLGHYFRDPRLRQLFGRYATYVGASPFEAPAVLMLIAEVEMQGVHAVRGGMAELARALTALAERRGVTVVCGQSVVRILTRSGRACGVECADGRQHLACAVVYNGDPGALAAGRLGAEAVPAVDPPSTAPSMSALTYAWQARVLGFPLAYHTVFFSSDYPGEFRQLFGGRVLPSEPTVYLCAQDRPARAEAIADAEPAASERLFTIINAPALGTGGSQGNQAGPSEQAQGMARSAALDLLQRCGLTLAIEGEVRTGPADFARLFPGNGGAIYGTACHGWRAPFDRPRARSRVAGLYLAGGGVHPGPGVPMVAISGLLAADAVASDLGS